MSFPRLRQVLLMKARHAGRFKIDPCEPLLLPAKIGRADDHSFEDPQEAG